MADFGEHEGSVYGNTESSVSYNEGDGYFKRASIGWR
jgi:hypothetical protein